MGLAVYILNSLNMVMVYNALQEFGLDIQIYMQTAADCILDTQLISPGP